MGPGIMGCDGKCAATPALSKAVDCAGVRHVQKRTHALDDAWRRHCACAALCPPGATSRADAALRPRAARAGVRRKRHH